MTAEEAVLEAVGLVDPAIVVGLVYASILGG